MRHRLTVLLALIICGLFPSFTEAALSEQNGESSTTCDVIIAGGSLASLAAAVSAANQSSNLIVCFLEPTDWPGGQLTASAVPAVDFGAHNRKPANIPRSFASFLFGQSMPGNTNLGDCWVRCTPPCALKQQTYLTSLLSSNALQVSTKCFLPHIASDHLVHPLLSSFPNLKTYLMTTIVASHLRGDVVTGVTAVQRTPRGSSSGWEVLTSR
jgi:hypothetical protein